MRDDFTIQDKEMIAKRVGFRCSNPSCRQPTSGPQEDPTKAINIGTAAHITAASEGGPRFNQTITSDERRSIENGIWLCQTCAKLVDNDTVRYPVDILRQWKENAEQAAIRELECRAAPEENEFTELESLMPKLLSEMREDLSKNPLKREFILLKKIWAYNGSGNELVYYYDDHPELNDEIRILLNRDLIDDNTHSNVARYIIKENFARYLRNKSATVTIFFYSGYGPMNTPPFIYNSIPFKLKYICDFEGHFAVQIRDKTHLDLAINRGVVKNQTYETFVYGFSGEMFFHVMDAPPKGYWKLWVTTT